VARVAMPIPGMGLADAYGAGCPAPQASEDSNTAHSDRTHAAAMAPQRQQRVMLLASAGGHWIELCRLSAAFADCDCLFVSTSGGLVAPVGTRDVIEVIDSSRDSTWTMARTFVALIPVIRAFDPDLMVSTGAAPGALGLLIAKMRGTRTIWVDSIANSETLSLSGRLVRPLADLRLTQWPHLADERNHLHYIGKVL
jgi:hypothetical protein